MKILVTGANGYLGSLFFAEFQSKYEVLGISRSSPANRGITQIDLRDRISVLECVRMFRPEVIIHGAAIASVQTCEKRAREAVLINTEGSLTVARAANEVGAKLILISSLAASRPGDLYGRSKRDAEEGVRAVSDRFEIVRLSMTFGLTPNTESRRPFNKILGTRCAGSPRGYDNTWSFQPTHTEHVVKVLDRLVESRAQGRVISIVADERVTMYRLASDILFPQKICQSRSYCDRQEIVVDTSELSEQGFPRCRYSNMVNRIRAQLAGCQGDK